MTDAQKQSIEAAHTGTSPSDNQNRLDAVRNAIQQNLDNAFGTGKIVVDSSSGSISFNSANGKDTVSVRMLPTRLPQAVPSWTIWTSWGFPSMWEIRQA